MILNKGMFLLICAVIGGCLGGYISYVNNNYIFSAIGPVIGIYIGISLNKFVVMGDLKQIRSKKYDPIFIVIGMLLSGLSAVAFYYTLRVDMLISTVFFFGCSIYLVIVKPKDSH